MVCILRDPSLNESDRLRGQYGNGYQSQTFIDIPGSTVGCLHPSFLYCIQHTNTVIVLREETAVDSQNVCNNVWFV